jgi:hypothetical protein
MNTAKARPAETGGLAAAVVALLVYALGVDDPALVAPLIIVVGAVPAGITWLVELMRRRDARGET